MKKRSKKQRTAFLITWAAVFILLNILLIMSPNIADITAKKEIEAIVLSFVMAFLIEPEVD